MLSRFGCSDHREVWIDENPDGFDGGTVVYIETDILPAYGDCKSVDVQTRLDRCTGSPQVHLDVGVSNGHLHVAVKNTAPPGSKGAITVDIWCHGPICWQSDSPDSRSYTSGGP